MPVLTVKRRKRVRPRANGAEEDASPVGIGRGGDEDEVEGSDDAEEDDVDSRAVWGSQLASTIGAETRCPPEMRKR